MTMWGKKLTLKKYLHQKNILCEKRNIKFKMNSFSFSQFLFFLMAAGMDAFGRQTLHYSEGLLYQMAIEDR